MKPAPPTEAIAWARKQKVVLPKEYYGLLQGRARVAAFSISGLSALDQIEAVRRSLEHSLASGESFGKWKAKVTAGEIPLGLPAHRAETIFRTNIQGWYAAGRCRAHQANKRGLPYLMYSAVNDSRTRPAHAAMHGYIARVDDPIWKTWLPPAGFNCRCTTIQISEEEAKRRGFKPFPGTSPDSGWDYSVCEDGPEEGVARAIDGRAMRCGHGAALSADLWPDPVEQVAAQMAVRGPWWCRHPVLKEKVKALRSRLGDWKDTERLVTGLLGDAWLSNRMARIERASANAGIDVHHGAILHAYTDRDLDLWREALLLGRVIVHDASLRGWTEERIKRSGIFLYLLDEAVRMIEPEKGTFYRIVDTRTRGFGQRFREQHKVGNTIEYVVPTSVMRSREALAAGGYKGDMVVELEASSARDIQAFSARNEPELLLPIGTQAITVRKDGRFLWMTESKPVNLPGNKKFWVSHVR